MHKSTTHREIYRHRHVTDAVFMDDYIPIVEHGVVKYYKAVTIFYRLEKDGWYKAEALCSVNDNFCRSIGRSVARRKYFNGKAVPCDDPTKPKESSII